MNSPLQPICLFADSQLLFWRDNGELFFERITRSISRKSVSAAYIGASNGDNPDFYAIFQSAMDGIGVSNVRMILSSFSVEDRAFLEGSDIILLAGGDVEAGWNI